LTGIITVPGNTLQTIFLFKGENNFRDTRSQGYHAPGIIRHNDPARQLIDHCVGCGPGWQAHANWQKQEPKQGRLINYRAYVLHLDLKYMVKRRIKNNKIKLIGKDYKTNGANAGIIT
jgi:hypothetical protein